MSHASRSRYSSASIHAHIPIASALARGWRPASNLFGLPRRPHPQPPRYGYDGYIFPYDPVVFDKLLAGHGAYPYYSVPFYTLHKIMAGLLDQYVQPRCLVLFLTVTHCVAPAQRCPAGTNAGLPEIFVRRIWMANTFVCLTANMCSTQNFPATDSLYFAAPAQVRLRRQRAGL